MINQKELIGKWVLIPSEEDHSKAHLVDFIKNRRFKMTTVTAMDEKFRHLLSDKPHFVTSPTEGEWQLVESILSLKGVVNNFQPFNARYKIVLTDGVLQMVNLSPSSSEFYSMSRAYNLKSDVIRRIRGWLRV